MWRYVCEIASLSFNTLQSYLVAKFDLPTCQEVAWRNWQDWVKWSFIDFVQGRIFLADTDTTFNTYFEIEYLLLLWRLMRLDMSVCVGTGPRGQVNPSGHMWHKVGKVTSVSAVVRTWGSRVSPNIDDPLPFIIPYSNPFITTSMLCVNLNYPSNSTWPSF